MRLDQRWIYWGVLAMGLALTGCSGGGNDDDDDTASAPPVAQMASTMSSSSTTSGPPTFADTQGFKTWLKFNKTPVDGRTHGSTDIYANMPREKLAPNGTLVYPFPEGTIIVKEILSNGALAVMKKNKGADPDHADWQFIEFTATGSLIAKDAACWGCHADAKAKDYVFTVLQ